MSSHQCLSEFSFLIIYQNIKTHSKLNILNRVLIAALQTKCVCCTKVN